MNRIIIVCLTTLVAAGCASSTQHKVNPSISVPSLETIIKLKKTVYLAHEAAVQNRIDAFFHRTPNPNGHHKINYLIQALRSSDITFVRNGSMYSGLQASMWLRWKTHHKKFRGAPILTAAAFIKRVATRSNTSGEYYQVRIDDMYYKLYTLLENELKALEKREVENTLDEILTHESFQEISGEGKGFQAPVIISPVAA